MRHNTYPYAQFPREWGVTHGTDVPIWFWGTSFLGGLSDDEKSLLKGWNEAFAAYVCGESVEWGRKEACRIVGDAAIRGLVATGL